MTKSDDRLQLEQSLKDLEEQFDAWSEAWYIESPDEGTALEQFFVKRLAKLASRIEGLQAYLKDSNG